MRAWMLTSCQGRRVAGIEIRSSAGFSLGCVTSTRTGSGRVPVGTSGNPIGSGDLNPQKARVLLSLALTRSSDVAQIRKIFEENQ